MKITFISAAHMEPPRGRIVRRNPVDDDNTEGILSLDYTFCTGNRILCRIDPEMILLKNVKRVRETRVVTIEITSPAREGTVQWRMESLMVKLDSEKLALLIPQLLSLQDKLNSDGELLEYDVVLRSDKSKQVRIASPAGNKEDEEVEVVN